MSIQQIKSGVIADSAIVAAKIASINAAVISAGTLPGARLPAGSVLQVVEGKLSTSFSTTSTSAVDTGLSATITPSSASNKIVCFVVVNGVRNTGTIYNTYIFLDRNGTKLDGVGVSSSFFTYYTGTTQTNGRPGSISDMILDAPNTTSAVTYKIQIAVENASSTSFISNQNTMLTTSTIILMEIAA